MERKKVIKEQNLRPVRIQPKIMTINKNLINFIQSAENRIRYFPNHLSFAQKYRKHHSHLSFDFTLHRVI